MTKAEQVFEKLAKKKDDFSFKQLAYGTAGGAAGAVLTMPIDTVATVGQSGKAGDVLVKAKSGIPGAMKAIKQDAKILSGLTEKSSKVEKAIALLRRYNSGLGAKILKIGPATGIAWATASHLQHKYGD